MISINELRNRLPTEFMDELNENYSPHVVDGVLLGIMSQRYTTLRVNTMKYNIQDLMRYFKEKNIKFDRVLWYDDALVIKNVTEKELQKLDIYGKGYIYIQSLSSMIPPLVLKPEAGEKVLDLTAAPGSKTTELSCLMDNKGYILANELDKIRYERLKFNVENQGSKITEVINGRGEKIGIKYPLAFDKVLLDTPCSGEGRFTINNVRSYKDWSLKKVRELVKMQKKLFKSAYDSLKPGGIMVYSTCTINKDENENILKWALENLELKMLDIDVKVKSAMPALDNEFNINKAIRILPSKDMEGFFVAKLQKKR